MLDGEIPGREGYKNAQVGGSVDKDYPGDYGGEDASTPMEERESVVGVGNVGKVAPSEEIITETEETRNRRNRSCRFRYRSYSCRCRILEL